MDKLVYHNGAVIPNAQVLPIFWGAAWNDAQLKDSAVKATKDLSQLMAGPYMLGLSQYSNISPARILPPVFDNTSEPPNTAGIVAVSSYVGQLISDGTVPDYRSNRALLYLVVTNNVNWEIVGAWGYHHWGLLKDSVFPDGAYHWVWVSSPSTAKFCHEIIEACADPDGSGWFGGGIEVADICEDNAVANALSDGIEAAEYWSNRDSDCIVPVRTASIVLDEDDCHIGPAIGGFSTLRIQYGVAPTWIDGSHLPPLANPKYIWTVDTDYVKVIGSPNQPHLIVQWLSESPVATNITVAIYSGSDFVMLGETNISPLNELTGSILFRMCQLRKVINNIHRFPIIDPNYGPGPLPDIKQAEAIRTQATLFLKEATELEKTLRDANPEG